MTIFDKKNKAIILVEGTVCNIGQINDRNDHKKRKYPDLRLGLSDLAHNRDVTKVLTNCQKWIISQNCEINKKFYSLRQ